MTVGVLGAGARRGKAAWTARLLAAAALSFSMGGAASAQAERANAPQGPGARPPTRDGVRTVAPALEKYEREVLLDNLWRRPDLSSRDRSLVTFSALVARGQTVEMPRHVGSEQRGRPCRGVDGERRRRAAP